MRYYDAPTQVKFFDVKGNEWLAGIAYRDEFICLDCGMIIKLSEIADDGYIVTDLDWTNISMFVA